MKHYIEFTLLVGLMMIVSLGVLQIVTKARADSTADIRATAIEKAFQTIHESGVEYCAWDAEDMKYYKPLKSFQGNGTVPTFGDPEDAKIYGGRYSEVGSPKIIEIPYEDSIICTKRSPKTGFRACFSLYELTER